MIERLPQLTALAERCAASAKRAGFDLAEVEIVERDEIGVKARNATAELITHGSERTLKLLVVRDHRSFSTLTNDLSRDGVQRCIDIALDLVQHAAPDPMIAVAPKSELAKNPLPNLSLWDDDAPFLDVRDATRRAVESERAARAYGTNVVHAESSCGSISTATAFATTAGFSGSYATSYLALMTEAVAETDAKTVSRHFTASRWLSRLDEAERVGEEAARRALAALGPRRLDAGRRPVVFSCDAGRAIMQLVPSVTSGTSFAGSHLADRLNQPIASKLVSIIDDAVVPGAFGSRPFDGEGLRSRSTKLVDQGVLRAVLTTFALSRRLKSAPTGSAVKTTLGHTAVSPSNMILLPGATRRSDVCSGIRDGLFITDLFGARFDPRTGDLGRVAAGFRIVDGELAYPVSRVDLSTSLSEILNGIDAVCEDLDFRTAFACPTFRVGELAVGHNSY